MVNVCTAYLDFSKSLNELLKRSLQTFELQAVLFFHFRFVRRVLRTPSRRVCRVAQVYFCVVMLDFCIDTHKIRDIFYKLKKFDAHGFLR